MILIKLWQVIEGQNRCPDASPLITFSFLLFPRFSFQPDLLSLGSWDLFLGPLLQTQTANQHGTRNPGLRFPILCFNTSLRWCKKLTCHSGSYFWYRTQLQNRLLLALTSAGQVTVGWGGDHRVGLGLCPAAQTRTQGTTGALSPTSPLPWHGWVLHRCRTAELLSGLQDRYHTLHTWQVAGHGE